MLKGIFENLASYSQIVRIGISHINPFLIIFRFVTVSPILYIKTQMFVCCLSIDLGTVRTTDFGRGMGMLLLETCMNCSEKYSHLPSQSLQKVTSQLNFRYISQYSNKPACGISFEKVFALNTSEGRKPECKL